MYIFCNNILFQDGVTTSILNENIKYPLSNLIITQMSEFTRINAEENYIQVDCSGATTIDSVVVGAVNPYYEGGANFTTCTFSSSDDGFNTSGNSTIINKQDNEAHLYYLFNAPITAKSFRLTFDGLASKDIGYLYIGKRLAIPSMSAQAQVINQNWTTKANQSLSGQTFGSISLGYEYLAVDVPIAQVSQSELKTFMEFASTVKNVTPFFCKIWRKSSPVRLMYCVIDGEGVAYNRTSNPNKPFKHSIKLKETF